MEAAMMGAPVQTLTGGIGIMNAGGGHGVIGNADLKVTQRGAGANMSVDVAAGYAFVSGTSILAQGVYSFANDAVTNVSITTANGSNPRIDLIVAQIRDNTADGGGSNDARLIAVAGTPAASPVVPAVPAGCLVLAQVAVGTAVSSITNANITDKRTWAAAIGGVHRCLATNRPTGVSLYPGLQIYEIDTDLEYTYNGTLAAFTARYNRLMGKDSETTASATSANATPVVTGLAVTIAAVSGRTYRIDSTHNLTMSSGTAPNYAQVLHYNGANITLFQAKPGAVGVYLTSMFSSFFVAGSTGNMTITIYFMNPLGVGVVQDYADGTALRYLMVTEIN